MKVNVRTPGARNGLKDHRVGLCVNREGTRGEARPVGPAPVSAAQGCWGAMDAAEDVGDCVRQPP